MWSKHSRPVIQQARFPYFSGTQLSGISHLAVHLHVKGGNSCLLEVYPFRVVTSRSAGAQALGKLLDGDCRAFQLCHRAHDQYLFWTLCKLTHKFLLFQSLYLLELDFTVGGFTLSNTRGLQKVLCMDFKYFLTKVNIINLFFHELFKSTFT